MSGNSSMLLLVHISHVSEVTFHTFLKLREECLHHQQQDLQWHVCRPEMNSSSTIYILVVRMIALQRPKMYPALHSLALLLITGCQTAIGMPELDCKAYIKKIQE